MKGYDENRVWLSEPPTEVQSRICAALGFDVSKDWEPETWSVGAFGATEIVVRGLPYLPEVNAILRGLGFRWDPQHKEWLGSDGTKAHVECLQALDNCAKRIYSASAPEWALKRKNGDLVCPVRVGAYSIREETHDD